MFIVAIAGGSGSGKSTFAKKVEAEVLKQKPDASLTYLHQDSYYLTNPPNSCMNDGAINFDHPEAFDWPLLRDHLKKLRKNQAIESPTYDFVTNQRLDKTTKVGPAQVCLFDGIYALWDEKIRNTTSLKVYVDVDADIRFIRRLHRDVKERGRTLDGIVKQYYDTVRPMHRKFLEPTRQYADIIVGEHTDASALVIASRILQYLSN